jgi:hypothetical protein
MLKALFNPSRVRLCGLRIDSIEVATRDQVCEPGDGRARTEDRRRYNVYHGAKLVKFVALIRGVTIVPGSYGMMDVKGE